MKGLQPSLDQEIVPVFRAVQLEDGFDRSRFCGTGFLVRPGILVTCWHVVSTSLKDDERYVALVPKNGGEDYNAHPLSLISQHPEGLDLAVARVPPTGSAPLLVETQSLSEGFGFWTKGYPLLAPKDRDRAEGKTWTVYGRTFKGYVTHGLEHSDRTGRPTPTLELSIPAPSGLSGAPLLLDGKHTICGVIFEEHTVYTIDEMSVVDPKTGKETPEVRVNVKFGLAHTATSLLSLAGPATNGKTLLDLQNTQ